MSAFICNNTHVTALAVFAARNRIDGQTDAKIVGQMLHAENVRSVNYRYGETTQPSFELCEWAAFHPFPKVQIVVAAQCLAYQSCEHPGWESSKACALLESITTHCLGQGQSPDRMHGYDDAQWVITPPAPPLIPTPSQVIANPKAYLPEPGPGTDNDRGNER